MFKEAPMRSGLLYFNESISIEKLPNDLSKTYSLIFVLVKPQDELPELPCFIALLVRRGVV